MLKMSLQMIIKSHIEKQQKNWESLDFLKQGVPELNVDWLMDNQDQGKLGVQVLFEEVVAASFSARCFEKMMFVHASIGETNMDVITNSAGARKVALIQFALGLSEFFARYQQILYDKLANQKQNETLLQL